MTSRSLRVSPPVEELQPNITINITTTVINACNNGDISLIVCTNLIAFVFAAVSCGGRLMCVIVCCGCKQAVWYKVGPENSTTHCYKKSINKNNIIHINSPKHILFRPLSQVLFVRLYGDYFKCIHIGIGQIWYAHILRETIVQQRQTGLHVSAVGGAFNCGF